MLGRSEERMSHCVYSFLVLNGGRRHFFELVASRGVALIFRFVYACSKLDYKILFDVNVIIKTPSPFILARSLLSVEFVKETNCALWFFALSNTLF